MLVKNSMRVSGKTKYGDDGITGEDKIWRWMMVSLKKTKYEDDGVTEEDKIWRWMMVSLKKTKYGDE